MPRQSRQSRQSVPSLFPAEKLQLHYEYLLENYLIDTISMLLYVSMSIY